MVADLVDVGALLLPVLRPLGDHADAGLALRGGAERGGLGQHGLQELQRDDLHAVVDDGVDARHAHVLQHLQVVQVAGREAHPELRPLDRREVLHEAFHLLVVHAVDLVGAHAVGAFETFVHGHRVGLDELPVLAVEPFPVAALGAHLADVDLRIEVGREGLAVVAAVHVHDVDRLDLVEEVLGHPGGEDVGGAGVEAAAQQRADPLRGEPFAVGPLPGVFELRGLAGLVVRGVEVVHARLEAGVHDRQVLVGKRDVHHQVRLLGADEFGHLLRVVGVDPRGLDRAVRARGDRLALGLGPAGERDLAEDFGQHGALQGRHLAHAARADDQDFLGHGLLLFRYFSK